MIYLLLVKFYNIVREKKISDMLDNKKLKNKLILEEKIQQLITPIRLKLLFTIIEAGLFLVESKL